MIRRYYKDKDSRKRPILQYAVGFFLLSVFLLVVTVIFVNIAVFRFPLKFKNESVGLMFCLVLTMLAITIISVIFSEKVARIAVPKMNLKSRLIAGVIRSKFKPMWIIKLLNIKKSIYGYPIPNVVVYVADDLSSGYVAIENAPLMNRLDSDAILDDLSGLMVGKILRRYGFISSELSRDGNYYLFHFEDVKTSQRFVVENGDVTPFISENKHNIKLANDLIWDTVATPMASIIGRTRSGKTIMADYLCKIMLAQGWIVQYSSPKDDIFVDRYHGYSKPEDIVASLEHWLDVVSERNAKIKKAGKQKYTEMPDMPDIGIFIDEISNLNGYLAQHKKLKVRWESAINRLTATGGSAGISVIGLSQFASKDGFFGGSARSNMSDCVIMLGFAASSGDDRRFLIPGYEVANNRQFGVGQGIARIVTSGEKWQVPHYYETPLFK